MALTTLLKRPRSLLFGWAALTIGITYAYNRPVLSTYLPFSSATPHTRPFSSTASQNYAVASPSEAASPSGSAFSKVWFTTLVLEDSEMVNHDVKRLRFKLPDGNETSGLRSVSEYEVQSFECASPLL